VDHIVSKRIKVVYFFRTKMDRPSRKLRDLQDRAPVRRGSVPDPTKKPPTSPRKDQVRDQFSRGRTRKNLTKAELIDQHAELKKRLQSLKAQRDAALEEEAKLQKEIQQLQSVEDDSSAGEGF
jgi:chromosome segregation ATPase